jgi:hypothetical protein
MDTGLKGMLLGVCLLPIVGALLCAILFQDIGGPFLWPMVGFMGGIIGGIAGSIRQRLRAAEQERAWKQYMRSTSSESRTTGMIASLKTGHVEDTSYTPIPQLESEPQPSNRLFLTVVEIAILGLILLILGAFIWPVLYGTDHPQPLHNFPDNSMTPHKTSGTT